MENVSLDIASEASYVYILSGQKLINSAKNSSFWRVFENLKFAVKQCYQTDQFWLDKNWWEMPKLEHSNETILDDFETMCVLRRSVYSLQEVVKKIVMNTFQTSLFPSWVLMMRNERAKIKITFRATVKTHTMDKSISIISWCYNVSISSTSKNNRKKDN